MAPKGTRATGGGATKMTSQDAARIQAAQAKAGSDAGKGSFPARAQAAAARNANASSPPAGAKGGKVPKAAS